jgi:hypothetical protein
MMSDVSHGESLRLRGSVIVSVGLITLSTTICARSMHLSFVARVNRVFFSETVVL